jgi:hypothetical protein
MFCVDTLPSGDTHAQRLATQIDEDVMAMPKAPVLSHRAAIEYVIAHNPHLTAIVMAHNGA